MTGQEQLAKACEEVRALEEDKRHVAVQAERVKIAELEAALARLTQVHNTTDTLYYSSPTDTDTLYCQW